MSEKDILDGVEEVVDVVEKAFNCELTSRQHLVQFAIVGAIAGAITAAGTYLITKRLLEAKYAQISKDEIAEARQFFSTLHKTDEFSTPESAVKQLHPEVGPAADALLKYQGKATSEEEEEPEETVEVETENVFTQSQVDDNFDLDEEVKKRTPDLPYIINSEEFLENDSGFTQSTLTYYNGDGTLADEQDQEVPFADPIVGEENLRYFGHGSGDKRVLYIRNERLSTEFEVLLHDGKFSHEVLGLEHSDYPDPRMRSQHRKSRGGDE